MNLFIFLLFSYLSSIHSFLSSSSLLAVLFISLHFFIFLSLRFHPPTLCCLSFLTIFIFPSSTPHLSLSPPLPTTAKLGLIESHLRVAWLAHFVGAAQPQVPRCSFVFRLRTTAADIRRRQRQSPLGPEWRLGSQDWLGATRQGGWLGWSECVGGDLDLRTTR